MRVTLPHTLGKEEVRRRMHKHADEIGNFFPAGLAKVTTGWPNEDRMNITAEVMGQAIPGGVEIREDEVVIEMDLPLLLSVMKGPLEAAVKKEAGRLLAP
ncbi:polyhydroxyalkanoic acid system family protein [Porphyrobacter sp. ULC335]|jgi:Putative polyhydroxyalkanoic acid system protein (PHA_gran_rgn)|uniref:polyhydroxyalkanoic acid system family protein n=1 Tax=Porphyrobacter sp. ULC335 TaxID=2854260 RepID=UPI00221E8A79|nr:polyhydroxyalkanoic acid system family protein [Porphyrobacter sp. ULC335]UYV16798.1 polyhydroxyalkanoic acid system family protein [Porphyrobacter sp. ULC335]